ncbi:MAG: bifunctional UDP-N-acetylglucosamine diphosphorylase/glucosamine-1-phosphate N-acetyltransferase GlmU [bacterium]|nr:bifunctional UDP-N-acetylglucosamine diphosphorylase/glucosamine-1-phosphate N-acetyltransferase GlmU [bacterium]
MSNKKPLISIILSAGAGTRMKSDIPKVLHKVLGESMLGWVIRTVEKFKPKKNIIVIGYKADSVKKDCEKSPYKNLDFAIQKKQLGSADALKAGITKVDSDFNGNILVLCGDTPLITEKTLTKLLTAHETTQNTVTILTAITGTPFSYGRIKRDATGNIGAIIEEKDASDEERNIQEINSGVYVFNFKALISAIDQVDCKNTKNEYYLTDAIKIIYQNSGKIGAYVTHDFSEILGINDKNALSTANQIKRTQINSDWIEKGVNIPFPDQVYIEASVKLGKDTTIQPGTTLKGDILIGKACDIGPNTFINDSIIKNNTKIKFSYVSKAKIGSDVKIGPFSHIRPDSKILDKAKVGNFTEIKNSIIGKGTKASHLSYIGDTELGNSVNIGAGTITCNYDGKNKFKTVIEDNCFIGSNTNLVAPVVIGKHSIIAAGSTINKNVPEKSLAIARSHQKNKPEWRKKNS